MFATYFFNGNGATKVWEHQFEQTTINSLLNHTPSANSESIYLPEAKTLYRKAIRNIKAGEEITSNYQQTMNLINKMGYTLKHDLLWFKKI
jgi:SET domain-containing protein